MKRPPTDFLQFFTRLGTKQKSCLIVSLPHNNQIFVPYSDNQVAYATLNISLEMSIA